jgi:predicted transposase YbfD/YdcC
VRGFGFPHAAQVVQVTRKTRELGTWRWRVVVVYAVTSLAHAQASPARLADLLRGHWAIENGLHWVRM